MRLCLKTTFRPWETMTRCKTQGEKKNFNVAMRALKNSEKDEIVSGNPQKKFVNSKWAAACSASQKR